MSSLEQPLKDFIGIVKQKESKQQLIQIQQQIKSLTQQVKGQSQVQQKISKKSIQTLYNQAYLQFKSGQEKNEHICINLIASCLSQCNKDTEIMVDVSLEQVQYILDRNCTQNEVQMSATLHFINQALRLGLLKAKEMEQKTLVKLTTLFQYSKAPRLIIERCLYKLFNQMFVSGDAAAACAYLRQTLTPVVSQVTINGIQISSCGALISIGTILYCVRQETRSKLLNEIIANVLEMKPGQVDEECSKLLYNTQISKGVFKQANSQQQAFINADYFSITQFMQNMAQNKIKLSTASLNAQLYYCFLLFTDKRTNNNFKMLYLQNLLNASIYFLMVSFQLENQVVAQYFKQNKDIQDNINQNITISLSKSYIDLIQQNSSDGSQIATLTSPIYNFGKLDHCIDVLQYLQFYLLQLINNFILHKNLGESEAISIIQYFHWLFVGNGILDIAIGKHKISQRFLTSTIQFNSSVFNQSVYDMDFLNTIFLYNEGHIQDIPTKVNIQIPFLVLESIFQVLNFSRGLTFIDAPQKDPNDIQKQEQERDNQQQTTESSLDTPSKTSQRMLHNVIQYGNVPYLNQESLGQLFDVLKRLVKLVQNAGDSKHIFSSSVQAIFTIIAILDTRCLHFRQTKELQSEINTDTQLCIQTTSQVQNIVDNIENSVETLQLEHSQKEELNQSVSDQTNQESDIEQSKNTLNYSNEAAHNENSEYNSQKNKHEPRESQSSKTSENIDKSEYIYNYNEDNHHSTQQVINTVDIMKADLNQSQTIYQGVYRIGNVEDIFEKMKIYTLQLLKLVAGVETELPWTRPTQLTNEFAVSCVFNQLTSLLPKINCFRPKEVEDALLSIVNCYTSFYKCGSRYVEIRSSIQAHRGDHFARGMTKVLNFNCVTETEETILEKRAVYNNLKTYFDALCGLICENTCNLDLKDLFSQILIGELENTDNKVETLEWVTSDIIKMSATLLPFENLRSNFGHIASILLKYQLCIQCDHVNNLPSQYRRVCGYKSEKLDVFNVIFNTFGIQGGSSAFFSNVLMEALEFVEMQKLKIAENVENIIQYIKMLYNQYQNEVAQEFLWCITQFISQIKDQDDYKVYKSEKQLIIFDILTDIITNLYEGQLSSEIDSNAVYQLLETFYIHLNDIQVMYQMHQFVQLQACNQINHNQINKVNNYIQMAGILLKKTQDCYLVTNTFTENQRSVVLYSLMHMFYNKIGIIIENFYQSSQDIQLVDLYVKYTQTSDELIEFILNNEKSSQYVFMIISQIVNLIQKNIDNGVLNEITDLQVQFFLRLLKNYSLVEIVLNEQTQEIHKLFIENITQLSATLGPQFNYSSGNIPELVIFLQLLKFIDVNIVKNKEFKTVICKNIEVINEFILNLLKYIENNKITSKDLLIEIMKFISMATNIVLLMYETYYNIKFDDSELFGEGNDNKYKDLVANHHPNMVLAQTFANYLIKLLPYLNKAKADQIIEDSDILDIQEQIKTDIITTIQNTINVQTYKYYAKIVYHILTSMNLDINIKKSIILSLIDIIKDSNVNEKFGNRHLITLYLLLQVIKHELVDNITIESEYKKWISDQLLGQMLQHITNSDMKNVCMKSQVIELVYKMVINGQADVETHIFPILSQLVLHWTPNANAADLTSRIYVDQDETGALDLKLNQDGKGSIASVGSYKQYGDRSFENGIKVIQKLCTQDTQTLNSVGKGIDPQIRLKAEQFYINHYKQIQKQYQKGHHHQENFVKYGEILLDTLPQHITKVFSASCDLFEQDESLAEFRNRYLRKLGQQCGFE